MAFDYHKLLKNGRVPVKDRRRRASRSGTTVWRMSSARLFAAFNVISKVQTHLFTLPCGLGWLLEILFCTLYSCLRAWSGSFVAGNLEMCSRPTGKLVLYEFEACPFCRKVREALSVLDLDVEVRPCPRETLKAYGVCKDSRFRTVVRDAGGKQQFPYFVDEGLGVTLQSSDAIVAHLWQHYGERATKPRTYALGLVLNRPPFFFLPSLTRTLMHHGMLRIPSKPPAQPLELWSFEGSPFCRVVREILCCLEVPYTLRNVAHGAAGKRAAFRAAHSAKLSVGRRALDGCVQVPLLLDPNTGGELLESHAIVRYLLDTYKTGDPPDESWADYSTTGASASHGTLSNGLMAGPSTPTPSSGAAKKWT